MLALGCDKKHNVQYIFLSYLQYVTTKKQVSQPAENQAPTPKKSRRTTAVLMSQSDKSTCGAAPHIVWQALLLGCVVS
jgi:hypothetical protein